MNIVCTACALGIGAFQLLLLRQMTCRITGLKEGSVIPFVIAKLLLYGASVTVVLLFVRRYALYVGIGYAIGFVVTLIITSIVDMTANKPTK